MTTHSGASESRKQIRARFLSGLLVWVPLAITIFVIRLVLIALTGVVRPLLQPWLGQAPEYVLLLVALLITVLTIYLTGVIAAHFVGRRLLRFGEAILLKLPIVKTVYAAAKQVVDTFSSSTRAAFQAVVLVEFPRPGAWALGFITGTLVEEGGPRFYRVFVPTTPNPTSGFLILFPEADVRFTSFTIEDGLRMIVSGGVLAPSSFHEVPPPAPATGTLPPADPAGDRVSEVRL